MHVKVISACEMKREEHAFERNFKVKIVVWLSEISRAYFRNHEGRVNLKTLRKREKKWLHMLTNWSYFMDNKYEKVKKRCRKGIPSSLRGRAWKHLCGATFHMEFSANKHVFEVSSFSISLLYSYWLRNPKQRISLIKN